MPDQQMPFTPYLTIIAIGLVLWIGDVQASYMFTEMLEDSTDYGIATHRMLITAVKA